jgi:hypothetical protein
VWSAGEGFWREIYYEKMITGLRMNENASRWRNMQLWFAGKTAFQCERDHMEGREEYCDKRG